LHARSSASAAGRIGAVAARRSAVGAGNKQTNNGALGCPAGPRWAWQAPPPRPRVASAADDPSETDMLEFTGKPSPQAPCVLSCYKAPLQRSTARRHAPCNSAARNVTRSSAARNVTRSLLDAEASAAAVVRYTRMRRAACSDTRRSVHAAPCSGACTDAAGSAACGVLPSLRLQWLPHPLACEAAAALRRLADNRRPTQQRSPNAPSLLRPNDGRPSRPAATTATSMA
jgi:hypothetical protein